MDIKENDVVQFIEGHKWCGCLGIVNEVKSSRILVGVPVPNNSDDNPVAYILVHENEIERIGRAVMITA